MRGNESGKEEDIDRSQFQSINQSINQTISKSSI